MSKIDHIRSQPPEVILKLYIESNKSISQTVSSLGCAKNNKQARKYIKEILGQSGGQRTNVFDRIVNYPNISEIIQSSVCLAEILQRINISDIRTNRYNLKNAIRHLGLTEPNWKKNKATLRGRKLWGRDRDIFKTFSDSERLPGNDVIKRHYLIWLSENGEPCECSECQLDGIWNNKPITLQLDHIDGNKFNNLLDNLRLLCPNCHSQTETYCTGNKRRY